MCLYFILQCLSEYYWWQMTDGLVWTERLNIVHVMVKVCWFRGITCLPIPRVYMQELHKSRGSTLEKNNGDVPARRKSYDPVLE